MWYKPTCQIPLNPDAISLIFHLSLWPCNSELLVLILTLGHSDFIIQATSSHKESLQSVRSSSYFFFIMRANVDMPYFINHNNGPSINAREKKALKETWLCFSELDVPKHNLIQCCSQKETDCWLLNSRNSHYLAPTVWPLEPKKKTSDSPLAKRSFTVFQRPALQSRICGWHEG